MFSEFVFFYLRISKMSKKDHKHHQQSQFSCHLFRIFSQRKNQVIHLMPRIKETVLRFIYFFFVKIFTPMCCLSTGTQFFIYFYYLLHSLQYIHITLLQYSCWEFVGFVRHTSPYKFRIK